MMGRACTFTTLNWSTFRPISSTLPLLLNSGENGHEVQDYLKECMNYQVTCYQKAEKPQTGIVRRFFIRFSQIGSCGNPDGHEQSQRIPSYARICG